MVIAGCVVFSEVDLELAAVGTSVVEGVIVVTVVVVIVVDVVVVVGSGVAGAWVGWSSSKNWIQNG